MPEKNASETPDHDKILDLDQRILSVLPDMIGIILRVNYPFGRSVSEDYDYGGKDATRQNFSESYCIIGRKIYQILLDPDANCMDEGRTSMIEVTGDEFLKWASQDSRRIMDVYHNLGALLGNWPRDIEALQKENKQDVFEAMFRYV